MLLALEDVEEDAAEEQDEELVEEQHEEEDVDVAPLAKP